MFTKIIFSLCMQLLFSLTVDGVTLSLNPSSMVIGSSTVNPVTSLSMQCSSSLTSDIDSVVQLKLRRRKLTETVFQGIATMRFNVPAKLDPMVPSDIQVRSPNISGSIDTDLKSGTMTLSISTQGLTCADQAEFQCELSYIDLGGKTQIVADNRTFTVITVPSDVIMDSPEYYDVNGKTLQLSNNDELPVGTRIKYKCNANVGSLEGGEITWERSSAMGSGNLFIPYTPTQPTDIVQDPSKQEGCYYRRTSTMYYNLTKLDDDGITFRCKAKSFLGGQTYEAISNQQFRVVAASASGGTTKPGASIDSNSGKSRFATNTIMLIILLLHQIMFSRFADG